MNNKLSSIAVRVNGRRAPGGEALDGAAPMRSFHSDSGLNPLIDPTAGRGRAAIGIVYAIQPSGAQAADMPPSTE